MQSTDHKRPIGPHPAPQRWRSGGWHRDSGRAGSEGRVMASRIETVTTRWREMILAGDLDPGARLVSRTCLSQQREQASPASGHATAARHPSPAGAQAGRGGLTGESPEPRADRRNAIWPRPGRHRLSLAASSEEDERRALGGGTEASERQQLWGYQSSGPL
jgi:hypothetical protein